MGYDPHGEEWHAARQGGIGGSEVAAIVGLSPWQSPFSLWARKVGELGPQESTPEQEWGHRLEPVVLRKWADGRNGQGFLSTGGGAKFDEAEPWRFANPDAIYHDDGGGTRDPVLSVVEAKTADSSKAHEWGPPGTDQIPPYYACQVLWYQDVYRLFEPAHLAVLIGGRDYREYVLPYDARQAAWLRLHARRFWRTVVEERRPDIDATDATYNALRAMHPEIERGATVQIYPRLWESYRQALSSFEDAERLHDLWRNRMLDAMGDAQYAHVGDERVARRQASAGDHASLRVYPAKKQHIIRRREEAS